MERFIKELFVFVADPEMPPDNNAAEWSLRHVVTSRKISGALALSKAPTASLSLLSMVEGMTLSSLFGTWRARGLNPFQECRQLLASPSSLNSYHLRCY